MLRGDRFEILQINGEIQDPATKEVIDVDAVKIGEFVVDTVRDKTASGAYGGQPLSAAYMTAAGKGYAARLDEVRTPAGSRCEPPAPLDRQPGGLIWSGLLSSWHALASSPSTRLRPWARSEEHRQRVPRQSFEPTSTA